MIEGNNQGTCLRMAWCTLELSAGGSPLAKTEAPISTIKSGMLSVNVYDIDIIYYYLLRKHEETRQCGKFVVLDPTLAEINFLCKCFCICEHPGKIPCVLKLSKNCTKSASYQNTYQNFLNSNFQFGFFLC